MRRAAAIHAAALVAAVARVAAAHGLDRGDFAQRKLRANQARAAPVFQAFEDGLPLGAGAAFGAGRLLGVFAVEEGAERETHGAGTFLGPDARVAVIALGLTAGMTFL
jgi:hypothetical protein